MLLSLLMLTLWVMPIIACNTRILNLNFDASVSLTTIQYQRSVTAMASTQCAMQCLVESCDHSVWDAEHSQCDLYLGATGNGPAKPGRVFTKVRTCISK